MKWFSLFSAAAALAGPSLVHAYEFRCRFVERVGTTDVVLPGNIIDPIPGVTRNIRLQFGVFDDAAGPAPAGGLFGWNVGTLAVSGPPNNSDERRNPGRIAPFNFQSNPNANGNPPLPNGDPFEALTEIDATLGTQSPIWVCDAEGNAPPMPPAVVRGRNTFVSVYAFSIHVNSASWVGYTVTASGNLRAVTEWRTVGDPNPPVCGNPADPSDDIPGWVTYAPFPIVVQPFSCSLLIPAPVSPGAAALLGIAAVFGGRRGRRR